MSSDAKHGDEESVVFLVLSNISTTSFSNSIVFVVAVHVSSLSLLINPKPLKQIEYDDGDVVDELRTDHGIATVAQY